ncbi:MAG: phosphoethanolamine transferase, partial [Comamonadaceae bacterium]
RPTLLLLVLGETARSGNFAINGYARPTTPELEREGAISFRNAWSCGTSTAASVPCMFSHLTRARFDAGAGPREGLMDVLQRAGLAVLWIDNQSGCKGVCDRIPHVDATQAPTSPLCATGDCLDGVMLEGLDARIAALDPQRVARGVVLVMHQIGSHGPAYHLRSDATSKRFLPECTSTALSDCGQDALVNAYDNSIVATDRFLGQAIGWLKARSADADTALLYVADHGESLGENNLYLHGMPYAVAPDVQKHVPWITWVSPGLQRSAGLSLPCLRAAQDTAISHDSYFHSVLGFMNVATSVYDASLDVYAPCRGPVAEVARSRERGEQGTRKAGSDNLPARSAAPPQG